MGATDRYHALVVKRVVTETDDAKSIVFDVPASLADQFTYRPGQFVTLRVVIAGDTQFRSYSMSSTPSIDSDLQVTVKRVPNGSVSNWLNDSVAPGDALDVGVPAGVFVLDDNDDDIVAFAGGSGITPLFSIVKEALHHTDRNVRLLFANRARCSAIFGDELDELAAERPDRLVVHHHEDATNGYLDPDDVRAFVGPRRDASVYICGPTPFMDVVEAGVRGAGVDCARVHMERFTPLPPQLDAAVAVDETPAITVTITFGAQTKSIGQRGRSTILQTARWGGFRAPSSCEAGQCATCMARVVAGEVRMVNNGALTPEEVGDGWVLTCQAIPVTPEVRVVYE